MMINSRTQRLKFIFPFLLIVLAYIWLPNFSFSSSKYKPKKNKDRRQLNNAKNDLMKSSVLLSKSSHMQKSSFEHWGSSPFYVEGELAQKAAAFVAKTKSNHLMLELNGILWEEGNPSVLIDNELREVGDVFDEFTVIEIKKDRVILSDGSIEHTLMLDDPLEETQRN